MFDTGEIIEAGFASGSGESNKNFYDKHVDHPWRKKRGWICQRKLKKILDKVIQLMYNIFKGMTLL